MAVKVLVGHGVAEDRILFVAFMAGRKVLKILANVFPQVKVIMANIIDDEEKRWLEEKYFGCQKQEACSYLQTIDIQTIAVDMQKLRTPYAYGKSVYPKFVCLLLGV